MPSFAPREQPIKKQQELSKREFEFIQAIRKNFSTEKLDKTAEKYRKAQLSLFKAKIHVAMEEVYKKGLDNLEVDIIQKDIKAWENKTTVQIIHEFKSLNKMADPGSSLTKNVNSL